MEIPVRNKVFDVLKQASQDLSLCDTTFIIHNSNSDDEKEQGGLDGQEFRAPRYLFAIYSPVFKAMLYGNMMEANPSNEVVIDGMDPSTFAFLIEYMYGMLPKLTASNVVKVAFLRKVQCFFFTHYRIGVSSRR